MKADKRIIEIFQAETSRNIDLPYADHGVHAGFPSPAQDYINESLDLNNIVIKNPSSTFFARVSGDSLMEDDICDGDILVVDKSLEPRQGDLAICAIDGEFTAKYIDIRDDGIWLVPANKDFPHIHVHEDQQFMIWGIVTFSLKSHRHKRK